MPASWPEPCAERHSHLCGIAQTCPRARAKLAYRSCFWGGPGRPLSRGPRGRRMHTTLELLFLVGSSGLGLALVLALIADFLDGPGPHAGER